MHRTRPVRVRLDLSGVFGPLVPARTELLGQRTTGHKPCGSSPSSSRNALKATLRAGDLGTSKIFSECLPLARPHGVASSRSAFIAHPQLFLGEGGHERDIVSRQIPVLLDLLGRM